MGNTCFNTQPPEGGWERCAVGQLVTRVSTHSRLKAAGHGGVIRTRRWMVSTHSRLKAAGCNVARLTWHSKCFNTQPPEGGWIHESSLLLNKRRFNTQPPEGGWVGMALLSVYVVMFQHTAA